MRKVIILFCLIVLTCQTAFADKQEWTDKNYDFTKVKRVLIFDPTIPNNLKNGITENEIIDTFKTKAKLSNVKIIELPFILESIKADTGVNLVELYQTNQSEMFRIFQENISKYVDITISSAINDYSMDSTYREGFSFNTTNYQTSYITGPGGTATIQTPTTQTHRVPGRTVPVAQAAVRFDVYDTKLNKAVFSRIDVRDRVNGTIFDNTKPKSLLGRITDSFFNDLDDKFKK